MIVRNFIGAMIAALWLMAAPVSAEERVVRIGLVADGPSEYLASFGDKLIPTAQRLVGEDRTLKVTRSLDSGWDRVKVHQNVETLLADPEVDMVVALGPLGSADLVARGDLPKPVVAPFVVGFKGQQNPRPSKARKNLVAIRWDISLTRDLKVFREVVEFKRVAVLVGGPVARAHPNLVSQIVREAKTAGVVATVVSVENDPVAVVRGIPADAEAVYLLANPQLPLSAVRTLANELEKRRLPSFSWAGISHVEHGILAGHGTHADQNAFVRTIALHIQALVLGEKKMGIGSVYRPSNTLLLNRATAAKLNVWPSWNIIVKADMIGPITRTARTLSLAKAIAEARQSNLDIASANSRVRAGNATVARVRSGLLPHIGGQLDATARDRDMAFIGRPSRGLGWSLTLSQVLYSDRDWADYRGERSLQRGRKQDRNAVVLDVTLDASLAYIDVLRAQSVERIMRRNFSLTRTNLTIAKDRFDAGEVRASEVFRWDSEFQQATSKLIDAITERRSAKVILNRVLNRPASEVFGTEELSLDDPGLLAGSAMFHQYLRSPYRLSILQGFLAKVAIEQSPELKAIAQAMDAQSIENSSAKRRLILPSFSVEGRAFDVFANTTASSEFGGGDFAAIANGGVEWEIAIVASLPIFSGGSKIAEISESKYKHQALGRERLATAQRIDADVRVNVNATAASYANIHLARAAAVAAQKNLELVTEAYARGAESIILLLDAQREEIRAQLVATQSIQDYLAALMRLARSTGRFEFFGDRGEAQVLLRRLARYEAQKRAALAPRVGATGAKRHEVK